MMYSKGSYRRQRLCPSSLPKLIPGYFLQTEIVIEKERQSKRANIESDKTHITTEKTFVAMFYTHTLL